MKISDRDKRTLRIAACGLAAYLLFFYGLKFVGHLERTRSEYHRLVLDADVLKQELETYETRAELVKKLRGDSGLDLTKVASSSLVGETGAAVQQAAQSSGVALGSIREGTGNASAGEIGSMQLEATGPIQGVLGFLNALDKLGYPLIINSIQFSEGQGQPGMLKVNLDMGIVDFSRWKEQTRKTNA